ncbi:MAG: hypothetical protein JSW16_03060, partial [Dehalococcoidales bacterium]
FSARLKVKFSTYVIDVFLKLSKNPQAAFVKGIKPPLNKFLSRRQDSGSHLPECISVLAQGYLVNQRPEKVKNYSFIFHEK